MMGLLSLYQGTAESLCGRSPPCEDRARGAICKLGRGASPEPSRLAHSPQASGSQAVILSFGSPGSDSALFPGGSQFLRLLSRRQHLLSFTLKADCPCVPPRLLR